MYEDYVVVRDSLRNDVMDGKTVGFSFGVRLCNYRGIYLSLVNGFYVEVDGVVYPREAQFLEVNGKFPRSMDEIKTCCWEHWDMQDVAYIHIPKEGGLEPGKHNVRYLECVLAAYGYQPTDEERVNNPPVPGDPMGGGKTTRICSFDLELGEENWTWA